MPTIRETARELWWKLERSEFEDDEMGHIKAALRDLREDCAKVAEAAAESYREMRRDSQYKTATWRLYRDLAEACESIVRKIRTVGEGGEG